jgi:hypothetical protein
MKSFFIKIYSNKVLFLAMLFLIAILSPLFYMIFFAVPAADDFAQAFKVKNLIQENGGLINYISYVIKLGSDLYITIQGCFLTNYLIYLNPISYNLNLLWIPLLLNFIFLIYSTFILSYSISKYMLKQGIKTALWLCLIVTFLQTQYIPTGETLYWYAGIVAYTFPYSLMLILFSLIIKINFGKNMKPKHIILSIFLGFIVCGTNYTTSLITCFIMFIITSLSYLLKGSKRTGNLFIFLSTLMGLIINVTAPGNSVRMDYFERYSLVKTILLSFYSAINYLLSNIKHTPLIFILIISIPSMFIVVKRINFDFKYPLIVSGISFIVLAAAYTPLIYGYGSLDFPSRYLNVVYFLFIWIFALNCLYITGWINKKYSFSIEGKEKIFVIVMVSIISFTTTFTVDALNSMASINAAKVILSGKAYNYKNEVYALFEHLESTKEKTVEVPPLKYTNTSIHMFEVYEDDEDWRNEVLSFFFNKKSIKVR